MKCILIEIKVDFVTKNRKKNIFPMCQIKSPANSFTVSLLSSFAKGRFAFLSTRLYKCLSVINATGPLSICIKKSGSLI